MRNMVLDNCLKLVTEYQKTNTSAMSVLDNKCVPELGSFVKLADSCEQLVRLKPNSVPGFNWIKNSTEDPTLVYCTAVTQCCQNDQAWARAALLDMTDQHQTCPQGFRQINSPIRACGRTTTTAGCNSMTFKTNGNFQF